MIRASDNLDDLTSDISHLRSLIGTITNMALDIDFPDSDGDNDAKKEHVVVTDLLWIARDIVEQLDENCVACHRKVIAAENARLSREREACK